MINKALEIAKRAHQGQVDKSGVDYIQHPITVASFVEETDEKIVAYLHDVVEDTEITLEDLRKEGFKEEILFAIDCITKRDKEPLENYYQRVILSDLSYKVKLADITHNSDVTRFKNPTEKDYKRSENYIKKKEYLMELYKQRK